MTEDVALRQIGEQRVGDAERDAAVAELRDHHVAGRLDRDEFDTRMTAALAARTRGDLTPLFVDLPRAADPAAGTPAAPAPARPPSWQRYGAPVLVSAIWPLTILVCILTDNWYLMALPFVVSMALGGGPRGHRMRGGMGCAGRRAQLPR